MNPRLLAVSGPLTDSIFPISSGEVPIGRDPANWLSISDPSLSRRHCVLVRTNDTCKILDLQSRNGTFVNGVAVQESILRHGDQISIGDSVFVFFQEDSEEKLAAGRVFFEEGQTQATAQIRPQDVLYLDPDRVLNELPAASRLRRNLNALLRVGRVVQSTRDLDGLLTEILRIVFEVVPAERGALLMDRKVDQFSLVFTHYREGAPVQPIPISRTITQQVMTKGVALLAGNVPSSRGLKSVDSLVSSGVHSLICVPLTMYQETIGCIYLDTTNPANRFDEEHLQVAAAIAGTSAVALGNASRVHWLEQENLRLTTEMNLEHNLVGESAGMKEVYNLISKVAQSESTILLQGESGTGKELVARAIYRNSLRSKKPFVAINCAAIPEGLVESELFGHEKGSFTGAIAAKKGRLEIADGGTVFLDEVGELSPSVQVKLLRVLQERQFERVGGTHPISVDIRLIAATNKDLDAAVRQGTFRTDLFYRLNVILIPLPPLRGRREDIPILAEHFIFKHSQRAHNRPKQISRSAMACLMSYDWPGNARELENVIERALVLNSSDVIEPDDLPESVLEKDPPPEIAAAKYHAAIKNLKKDLIARALEETSGNVTEAARTLGIHANYLHRLIRNLDLRDSIRPPSSANSKTSGTRP